MACFNDWPSVNLLLPDLDAALNGLGMRAEVVVIDDGSTDDSTSLDLSALTLNAIERVTTVTLIRNLGNQRAFTVGLGWAANNCPCDYLILMDADHEDRPSDIPALIESCDKHAGKRIIFASRTKRADSFFFKAFYAIYKIMYRALVGTSISFGNFSVIPGAMVRRVAAIGEIWIHYPAGIISSRIPYASISAERGKRLLGVSKMRFINLIIHAVNGFSVHADAAGVRLMLILIGTSIVFSFGIGISVALRLWTDIPLPGWTSQFVAILFNLVVQAVTAAMIMIFAVFSLRSSIPFIPLSEYQKFILDVVKRDFVPAP
jgi:glycosyltransferase involved in cell wall biosynthesis